MYTSEENLLFRITKQQRLPSQLCWWPIRLNGRDNVPCLCSPVSASQPGDAREPNKTCQQEFCFSIPFVFIWSRNLEFKCFGWHGSQLLLVLISRGKSRVEQAEHFLDTQWCTSWRKEWGAARRWWPGFVFLKQTYWKINTQVSLGPFRDCMLIPEMLSLLRTSLELYRILWKLALLVT